MKKITNFIVNNSTLILILVTIISMISLYFSSYVTVNYDMANYLPKDSETRIGMDIMNEEFDNKASNLNIMFTDLSENQKDKVLSKLLKIKGVKSVDYNESADYNKDNYTLYVVNVSATATSKTAKEVYKQVTEEFNSYEYETSGSISEANKPVLHLWIIIVAIISAMIILIIMCESFIEPFLFLFSIGLAVFLNMGTNLIFDNVSFITQAIAAILQLALSMDYSIMLMNRYTQEREKTKDKKLAMKEALYHSFKAISSSSITTIVGLLALVFMSFTIGKDLGFVLAKGVLLSLLSIFLTLPGLILLCDNLIIKTRKKGLKINMRPLGNLVYKFKVPILLLFILLFVTVFNLKNNVSILYTISEDDKIQQVFTENNQLAIIYKNKDEEFFKEYCSNIEPNKNIQQVLCYGNTINQELKYNEVNPKIKELGLDTSIDDYLLKILYYNKYHTSEVKMSIHEFIDFVNNYALDKVDTETKNNLDRLSNFVNQSYIDTPRDYTSLGNILGIDSTNTKQLIILYNSNNQTSKITTASFIEFLNNNVVDNPNYNKNMTSEEINQIKTLSSFANKDFINKEMTKEELSKIFGLDEDSIDKLLLLYNINQENTSLYTVKELINGIDYLKNNTNYLDDVDLSTLTNLKDIINNENIVNEKLPKAYLKNIFDRYNPDLVENVYQIGKIQQIITDDTMFTPIEFIDLVLTNFKDYLTEDEFNNLSLLRFIMQETLENNKYDSKTISNILKIDTNQVNKIYNLIDFINKKEFTISPLELTNLIINNASILNLQDETLGKVSLLNKIMTSINTDDKLDYNQMSELFSLNKETTKLLYSLYNGPTDISLYNFVNFLVNNIIDNEEYSKNFKETDITMLKTLLTVMNDSRNNYQYSSTSLHKILSNFTSVDSTIIDLVYIYNGSVNYYDNNWTITLENLVDYANNDIINSKVFKPFITKELKDNLHSAKENIASSKKLLVGNNYSRIVLNTSYDLEGNDIYNFIDNINNDLIGKDKYLVGSSTMAYELNQTFDKELNFISKLTILAVYIVVAITFKSLIIPLVLVSIIDCAVYTTMASMSLTNTPIYFISLLIVQSILMGATIDYAIVYTSYYKEARNNNLDKKSAVINAYNNSISTILSSASILIIVTLIVGGFASSIAAKICLSISKGTFCSLILILLVLPPLLTTFDKYLIKNKEE